MKMSNHWLTCILLTLMLAYISCRKILNLDANPDSDILTISNIENAQAILDNIAVMRETPSLGEISSDNFYLLSDSGLKQLNTVELNAYCWKEDIFQGSVLAGDWFLPYRQVYYANSILDAIPDFAKNTDASQINHVKGSALFIRAYAFHNLALEFANLYSTSGEDAAGIPLRLTSDPEVTYLRASLHETYERILADVKEARQLLKPEVDRSRKNRPSQPASFALLARVYLSMGDFTQAKLYADSCLMRYSSLIDYAAIQVAGANPFDANNEEVLYQSNLRSETDLFQRIYYYIDTVLFRSYSINDLRKELFFSVDNTGNAIRRFTYSGDVTCFSGLAVDEVFLIRAECNARLGYKDAAIMDMVTLLTRRYKNGTYSPPPVNSANEALEYILAERRKELVFRGLRWIDIRRLNRINPSITLHRELNNERYTLLPASNRYILPIPPDVIGKNNGIYQNPR